MADINYTNNIDSLTNGDLHGQDSWVNTNNPSFANCTVQTTIKYAGAKGLKFNGYAAYERAIVATTGTIYWRLRVDTTAATGDGPSLALRNATQYNFIIKTAMNGANLELQYYSAGSYTTIQTLSTGQWYIVGVDFDQPNNRYRYSTDGGLTWSGWVTQGTSGAAASTKLQLGSDVTWVGYIDEISATAPTVEITVSENMVTADTLSRSMAKVFSETAVGSEPTMVKATARAFVESSTLADLPASLSRTLTITVSDSVKTSDLTATVLNLWTKRTPPSTSWSIRSEPSSSWTDRTKPSTVWS